MKRDYRQAELEPADRAMLDYVALLTLTPARSDQYSRIQSSVLSFFKSESSGCKSLAIALRLVHVKHINSENMTSS